MKNFGFINDRLEIFQQLKWDSTRCGTGIAFQSRGTIAYLKQSSYVFRSVITSTGFMNGQHYWEIHADNRTQNQFKIGVATTQNFEYNTAFCDHAFGFAFYGLGQLRHNSNSSGPEYGKRFKKQGILGCYLNMDKGTLAFSLNGQSFGNAYQDESLCKGPIFPAVSLLHQGACNIKGELSIPKIFKNFQFLIDFKSLIFMQQKVGSMNNILLEKFGQLKWDSTRCGTGIAFQSRGTIAYLKQSSYVFRSVITSTGFMNGQHYWEIHADNRTQNQFKIGVATTQNFEYNTAFCDHAFGFAFYGLGQLRHNSNSSGPEYGKRFKKQGILGCYLNMDKGTLAFSLNGQSFGNAYQDESLCKGPIFPAVSLLHQGACNIKGELPIPKIFKN